MPLLCAWPTIWSAALHGRASPLGPSTTSRPTAPAPLGDPIEAGALDAVLGRDRDPDQPLLLGSVKSNVGHLESAAGIAGPVKTVLALHHDHIPPSLHCADGSALGDDARLRVVTEAELWPRYGGIAVAGVSGFGFGFGGTNARAVLEEWRPGTLVPEADEQPTAHLFPLSDIDAERVRDTAGRLADWLHTTEGRTARLADVARTLAGRTGHGRVRAAVTARDRTELADSLGKLARQRPHERVVTGDRERVGRGPVWVFSGYHSKWAGMGRRLLAEEPLTWRDFNPRARAEGLRGTALYVSNGSGLVGGSGDPLPAALESALWPSAHLFTAALARLRIPVTTHFYTGGGHDWPYWKQEFAASWPMLAGALGLPE
ncbi:ketoacyl-synthetase C-terminal extension domain-containing protein [Streptomyces sp. NPDC050287]|uniref:ketoacyl-synthetase C-terminal extension domain-containing protein n=1 Tax=Streptomyces sp. NPDC050287 TaxID=3365608 RepID=UPI00379ABFE0